MLREVKCDKQAGGQDDAGDCGCNECTVRHGMQTTLITSARPNDVYVPLASTLEGMRHAERV